MFCNDTHRKIISWYHSDDNSTDDEKFLIVKAMIASGYTSSASDTESEIELSPMQADSSQENGKAIKLVQIKNKILRKRA